MELITRQSLADGAAERWRKQYPKGCPPDKEAMAQRLAGLPKGTPPDEIDRLIGNESWTNLTCHECGAEGVELVLRVGEPLDYESRTADLCERCVIKLYRAAMAKAEGST